MSTPMYLVSVADSEMTALHDFSRTVLTEYDLQREVQTNNLQLREVIPTPFVDIFGPDEKSTFSDGIPIRFWFRTFEILNGDNVVGVAVYTMDKEEVITDMDGYVREKLLAKYDGLFRHFL